MSNFKLYLQEIYKLQVQLYTKTDQVVPQDPQGFRSFIQQIKPTNLNQDKKSIFSLMNRDKIIDQNEYFLFLFLETMMLFYTMLLTKKDKNLLCNKFLNLLIRL